MKWVIVDEGIDQSFIPRRYTTLAYLEDHELTALHALNYNFAELEAQLDYCQTLANEVAAFAQSDPEQVAFAERNHPARCRCARCETERREVWE